MQAVVSTPFVINERMCVGKAGGRIRREKYLCGLCAVGCFFFFNLAWKTKTKAVLMVSLLNERANRLAFSCFTGSGG